MINKDVTSHSAISDRLWAFGSNAIEGTRKTLVNIGTLSSDATFTSRICQVVINIFAIAQKSVHPSISFYAVILKLSNTVLIFDTLGGLDPLAYFLSGKHIKKGEFSPESLKQGAFLISGASGLVALISEIAALSFTSFGKVLDPVILIGAKMASGFAAVGFVFYVCEDIKKLRHPKNDNEKTKTLLDLTSHVAGVALAVIGLVGVTSVTPIVVLGAVSAGFGAASQLYAEHCKHEKSNTKENN